MKNGNSFSKWEQFCNYVRTTNRFALNKEWGRFIEHIVRSACKRGKNIPKGTKFWRARISEGPKMKGKKIINEPLSIKEMLAPSPEKASDGRVNPKGIPCLYLAEDYETAIAEVRPYINATLTLGLFELNRDIKVVDVFTNTFSLLEYRKIQASGKSIAKLEDGLLWWGINLYYSVPVMPDDKYCSYVPTQYLSELLKSKGYDGILYGSAQKQDKFNLALFDVGLANLIRREQKTVHSVEYVTDLMELYKKQAKAAK